MDWKWDLLTFQLRRDWPIISFLVDVIIKKTGADPGFGKDYLGSGISQTLCLPSLRAFSYSETEKLNLILNSESVLKNIYNRGVEDEKENKSYGK